MKKKYNIPKLMGTAKVALKISVQQYRSNSRNKKNLKQSNFTPRGTRERRTNEAQKQWKEGNTKDWSRRKKKMKQRLKKQEKAINGKLRAGSLKR